MKNLIYFTLTLFLCSCSTTYLLNSEDESFDSLTKITSLDNKTFSVSGGHNAKNLVFLKMEDGSEGFTNIYLKDNVLNKAITQKTSGNGFNRAPDYCVQNNKIAFQKWDKSNLNFDIYYMDANKGKAITQVTYTDQNEGNPSWSNDGDKIVFEKGSIPSRFISLKNNKISDIKITENEIWVKNIKTSELSMLGEGSMPTFSPDGKHIAFIKFVLNKNKSSETGTLWIMDVDGGSPKQLTDSNLGYARSPSWSANSKSLVFDLEKPGKLSDPNIYTIDIDGDKLTQHTFNESNDFNPHWSNDNYIYFSSDRGEKQYMYNIFRFKVK